MDNETKEILQQILAGQQELKGDITSFKQGQEHIVQRLDKLEQLATKTALTIENIIEPKIQLIYENQTTIIDHDKKLTSYDSKIEALETDVFALKYAFKALKQG